MILWLVEPSTFIGAGERHIAEQLKQGENPGDSGDQQDRHSEKQEEILTFIDAYRKLSILRRLCPYRP